MANTNARFTDIGANQQSEMIATNLVMTYNPTNQNCAAIFHGSPHLLVANTYYPLGSEINILYVDFTDKMQNCYANGKLDPVTNAALDNISIAGLMTYIKDVYDIEFNIFANTANTV